ncbi:MAG TPA: cupin domain-containing protein [Solirubrobacteraceae bacterium]|nr:cupin domain-containing protein [Solirubrobacteraceae bacterium]
MANIYEPEYDDVREHPGFRARRARVGLEAGAERLGLSVWELPAGEAAYPYHYHLGEEELLVVLEGTPELRTPDGWRRLQTGEVVAFPRGEDGAHQLLNRGDQTARFLALSTNGDPDIVLYPDSRKLSAAERRPQGGGMREVFRLADAVDYLDGEQPPER